MPILKSINWGDTLVNPELTAPQKKKQRIDDDALVCTVCQSSIRELTPTALPCGHKFHASCCQASLQSSMRCPNCRQQPYLAEPWRLKKHDRVFMPIIIQVNSNEGERESFVVTPPSSHPGS